jgi:ABC-type polysaccharide/polyol phosphate transport system ATPase subunit
MIIFFLLNFQNILIDEFVGFGDKFIVNKFYEKLSEKFIKIDTLVVASHNQNLINKFCNRVVYLEEGKIIKDEKI